MAEVVLEDAVLKSLAMRPEVRRDFPELKSIVPLLATARAGACCRQGPDAAAVFQSVKQSLSHLSDDRRRRLKEVLGATSIRLYVRGPSGVRVVVL